MRLIIDSSPSLKGRIQRAVIFLLVALRQLKGGQVSFTFDRFGTAEELRSGSGFMYLLVDDNQQIDCLTKKAAPHQQK
ncbi:hypothetical protein [Erwinia sp. SLM-02]|uniref:hypothetical protein n=1 Tax=Erwinia sp. SLM-02 TaxID=3020057 RepID=UPI003080BBF3